MAATQRLLLVGSSHFTRLQDYLQQNPEAAAGTNFHFVVRKGLRAAEGLKFVKRHHQEIANFKPTHVIIHLGGNDVLPRDQKLPLGDLAIAISHLKLLGKWLASQYNAQVFYSEFLPHARYPCPPGHRFPDDIFKKNQLWLIYNKTIANARNNRYSDIGDIIFHPQLWDGVKRAKNEYYETEHYRTWWGLHLNQEGRKIMWENFKKIII